MTKYNIEKPGHIIPEIAVGGVMEIKREVYLQKLINRMHNGMIKVITGIRRSGKSYLLFTIFRNYLKSLGVEDDHIIAIELDMFENEKYRNPRTLLEYVKRQMTDEGGTTIFFWMKYSYCHLLNQC